MQLNSSELFSNFSEELSRRLYTGEDESYAYEQECINMHRFITSPEYMDLDKDISEANLQLLCHIENCHVKRPTTL